VEVIDLFAFFARKTGQWHAAFTHRVWYV